MAKETLHELLIEAKDKCTFIYEICTGVCAGKSTGIRSEIHFHRDDDLSNSPGINQSPIFCIIKTCTYTCWKSI